MAKKYIPPYYDVTIQIVKNVDGYWRVNLFSWGRWEYFPERYTTVESAWRSVSPQLALCPMAYGYCVEVDGETKKCYRTFQPTEEQFNTGRYQGKMIDGE